MIIEWDSPPPDAYSNEGYRAFIKDLHDKLTSDGTGITHMSELSGQFDLVTGVVPIAVINKTVEGLPLYYKIETVGKKTIYIKIRFDVYLYNSSTHVKNIMGYVRVYDRLDSAGVPVENYYQTNGNNTDIFNEYYNMSLSFISVVDSNFRYTGGKSVIIINDGTIVIQYCMGTKSNSTQDFNKAILSIMIESGIDYYSSIGYYNNSINNYTASMTASSSYYVIGYGGRAAFINSWGYNKYTSGYVRSLSLQPNNSLIPISYINYKNGFSKLDNIYYYNANNIIDEGISLTVDGHDYYFLGRLIYDLSITSSDTNVYGFAIRLN